MPLDLTKPIRRKEDDGRVYEALEGIQLFEGGINPGSVVNPQFITRSALERLFENIPEPQPDRARAPRKPREWMVAEYPEYTGKKEIFSLMPLTYKIPMFRVIEWPEGAPLPDLPEGY